MSLADVRRLSLDDAIDYREGNVYATLKSQCPGGVDVYFDNTGGPILEAVLSRMNLGRTYRLLRRGFAVRHRQSRIRAPRRTGSVGHQTAENAGFHRHGLREAAQQAERDLAKWTDEGALVVAEDIIDGLDHAPAGLVGLFAGENRGKRMIRVALD